MASYSYRIKPSIIYFFLIGGIAMCLIDILGLFVLITKAYSYDVYILCAVLIFPWAPVCLYLAKKFRQIKDDILTLDPDQKIITYQSQEKTTEIKLEHLQRIESEFSLFPGTRLYDRGENVIFISSYMLSWDSKLSAQLNRMLKGYVPFWQWPNVRFERWGIIFVGRVTPTEVSSLPDRDRGSDA